MLNLNEDCLREICSYLGLRDHLALADTCKYLQEFIRTRFQSMKSLTEDDPKRRQLENSAEPVVCELKLFVYMQDALFGYKFNNIKSLCLTDDVEHYLLENFEFVARNIFPNLKKLHIPSEHATILRDVRILNILEEVKISELNFKHLCQIEGFRLPQNINKVILTAVVGTFVPSEQEYVAFYSLISHISYRLCLRVGNFELPIVEHIIENTRYAMLFNDEPTAIQEICEQTNFFKYLERVFFFSPDTDQMSDDELRSRANAMFNPIIKASEFKDCSDSVKVAILMVFKSKPKCFTIHCTNTFRGKFDVLDPYRMLEVQLKSKVVYD